MTSEAAFLFQPADHALTIVDVFHDNLAEARSTARENFRTARTEHDLRWWRAVVDALDPAKARCA